jgi:membrane protein
MSRGHRRLDWSLFTAASSAWASHNAPRLGAALAYYSILSLAPLLLVIAGIASLAFGRDALGAEFSWQIRAFAGEPTATVVEGILRDAHAHPASGVVAGLVAFIMLLLGASGVFVELRDDLNYIWDVPNAEDPPLRGMLRYRVFSFALVLGSGFLIVLSMAASIAFQAMEKYEFGSISIPASLLEVANLLGTLLATTVLFGLIYIIFPARRVPWHDVAVGAIVTAILFTGGKSAVGLFMGKAAIGSLYGAAGSVVVLLVWVYYSSQIFLFGAEFTHIYSQRGEVLSEQARHVRADTPIPPPPSER